MNSAIQLRLLAVTGLILGLCGAAAAQPYPRLGHYGNIRGNGNPYIQGDINGPLDGEALDAVARFHEVVLGISPLSEYRPDVLSALRQRRPDIRILAYALGHYIWPAAQGDTNRHYPTRIWRLITRIDGFLYNTSGGLYGRANVNLAKRDGGGRYVVAESLAVLWDDVVLRSGLWDGIFFDQICEDITWSQTTQSIDFQRAGYANQAAFQTAWKAATDTLARRLRQLAGPEPTLVGNCGNGNKYAWFNGWMRENFPLQGGGNWYRNMMDVPWGYLYDDTAFVEPTHNYLFSTTAAVSTPYTTDNCRRVRYGLASAALGAGFGVFGPENLDVSTSYHEWWYDEYAVDLSTGRSSTSIQHTGWLREPLGPYYQMIWAGSNPDAVTNPEFETDVSTGWSLFNAVPATVVLDASTAASGGASVRITVPSPASTDWYVSYTTTGTIPVVAGSVYSATFWAKASRPCLLPVLAAPTSGNVGGQVVSVDTTWKRYQATIVPSASVQAHLTFYVGHLEGDLWLDDVHFQYGATSLYRRDFQEGSVLVNPSPNSLTVPLGRAYRRIQGVVDPGINNGQEVTQVTVPPNDALFLIGQDLIPPAAILDLHPIR